MDRHFIKEKIEAKIVQFPFVKSKDQLADILKKAVSGRIFHISLDKFSIGDIDFLKKWDWFYFIFFHNIVSTELYINSLVSSIIMYINYPISPTLIHYRIIVFFHLFIDKTEWGLNFKFEVWNLNLKFELWIVNLKRIKKCL